MSLALSVPAAGGCPWDALVDRYQIGPARWEGYYATVHYGRMPDTGGVILSEIGKPGDLIAIKVPTVKNHEQRDRHARLSIAHEGDMLARVFRAENAKTHLFVRGLHDPRHNVLVMELLHDAKTLRQWVRDPTHTPTKAEIESLIAQLHRAQKVLEKAGVVHGDLSDKNILILPGPQIRIVDFGVAALVGTRPPHLDGHRYGTEDFQSPNQLADGVAELGDDAFAIERNIQTLRNHLRTAGRN